MPNREDFDSEKECPSCRRVLPIVAFEVEDYDADTGADASWISNWCADCEGAEWERMSHEFDGGFINSEDDSKEAV